VYSRTTGLSRYIRRQDSMCHTAENMMCTFCVPYPVGTVVVREQYYTTTTHAEIEPFNKVVYLCTVR
jgi:hypothetical protein